MQVTMNDPMYPCPDFDDNKMKINLTGVMFTQNPDDACTLNGKYTIAETIDGPISVSCFDILMYKCIFFPLKSVCYLVTFCLTYITYNLGPMNYFNNSLPRMLKHK